MTARELLEYSISTASYQVAKVFEGLPQTAWTDPATPDGMTPKEIAAHLCECYHACSEMAQGRTYEWGSFKVGEADPSKLLAELTRLKQKATALALNGDENVMKESVEFLCLHDAYHVGQIALIRLRHQPEWDPYSIYNH